jgi:hypothetical protein
MASVGSEVEHSRADELARRFVAIPRPRKHADGRCSLHRARRLPQDAVVTSPGLPDTIGTGPSNWPDLTLSTWEGTREALQLWFQIVGKLRLAHEPMVNHWWQVPLYVSARGLTTSLMHAGHLGLEAEFDFGSHVLELRTTEGRSAHVGMVPGTVADFYRATLGSLDELGVEVELFGQPVEMPGTVVPFATDTQDRPYDAIAARRFWLALVEAHRVMSIFRSPFVGKVSPVHFFWGSSDIAVTRFSGRRAPLHPGGTPNCGDFVQELAYSHEVSSCGFWPGGSEEGWFYSYAYPEPDGFSRWAVEPAEASYSDELGEFLLSYRAVRTASDPDRMLLSFFQSTYEAAAELGGWQRRELEVSELPSADRSDRDNLASWLRWTRAGASSAR